MDTFFPALLLSILAEFRQCFTKPNYKYFRAYVWAMMINNSSKCVTNMAEACFFLGKHLSSFARFLADNKWDSSKVKKKMVEILLSYFPEQFFINGAFLGVIDTTLVAKASKKMFGVQKWHLIIRIARAEIDCNLYGLQILQQLAGNPYEIEIRLFGESVGLMCRTFP